MTHTDKLDWMLYWCEDHYAFFSPTNPQDMIGDDWNDAPYEHNAGYPYDIEHYSVFFVVDKPVLPKTGHVNSPYTLEDINHHKVVPWLIVGNKPLFAGATLHEFIQTIQAAGGGVYVPLETAKEPA